VHWKTIGHAITRNDYIDISSIEDSHGFWAPDISYHNGLYYIFATLRLNDNPDGANAEPIRRQVVVTATDPKGPWTRPSFIDIDGIDPSHFIDDDGRHYMLLHPGARIVQLDDSCTNTIGEITTIWPGTGLRCPEGPHILKKDGWYYCILAEGGTGYHHQVSVARSRNLFGPYEQNPNNPVMTQSDPNAIIQRAGHGKLVCTQKGDWWMVYLCGRPNHGRFTTLGRETALDPVQWKSDGWFTVNNNKGPSTEQTIPSLATFVLKENIIDDFSEHALSQEWQFVRNPDNELWSLEARPGHLRIITGNALPGSLRMKNIFLRREAHFNYRAITCIDFSPDIPGPEAGIIAYHGRHCFIKLFISIQKDQINIPGRCIKAVALRNDMETLLGTAMSIPDGPLFLKTEVTGHKRSFFWSADITKWILVGEENDASYLSNEGVTIGKHHTGTLVGLYAASGDTGCQIPADFDWFSYEGLEK